MSVLYAVGMSIAAFMLYGGLETMGTFSSLIHVVSVCVDKANAVLGLDTMDIDGKELNPENHDIEVKNRRNLTLHTREDNDGDRRTIWRWKDNPVQSDRQILGCGFG